MRRGRHAAADRSFRRSAGVAAGRGVLLVALAVVIGVVLLERNYKPASSTPPQTSTTSTTLAPSTTTTTGASHGSTTTTTATSSHSTTTTARRSHSTTTTAATSSHSSKSTKKDKKGASTTTTTAAPTVPPAQVKALVANGTQVAGLAGRIVAKLQSDHYNVLSPANATQQVTASAVYYVSGSSAAAAEVASAIGLSSASVHPLPSSPPVSSLDGAKVLVVAGPDLASRFPASTSSTTSPAS